MDTGFDAVSTTAQECKNPQRDIPIGTLLSLFVCTILYIIVSLIVTGLVPYETLNVVRTITTNIDMDFTPICVIVCFGTGK